MPSKNTAASGAVPELDLALYFGSPLRIFNAYWLAHQQGCMINLSQTGNALGIDGKRAIASPKSSPSCPPA